MPDPIPDADAPRVLRLTMRIAVTMLGAGAQTDDVEETIDEVGRALGLPGIQCAVTFSTISISWDTKPDHQPLTLLHIVRDRTVDFSRLASAATLARRIHARELDLAQAEAEMDRLRKRASPYPRALAFVASGLSATGSTLVFGGDLLDAATTLGIALVAQPLLNFVDRQDLPPFFRLVFGSALSTLLVVLLVALGMPINGGLVLTGSLLRFLPGYALVSGFRDLIGQSIVSGTARLAEALLLGAAVAGGTAIGLLAGTSFEVYLSLVTSGQRDWALPVSGAAALLAVGAYAVRLEVPPRSVLQASVIGAAAWILFLAATGPVGRFDPSVATFAVSFLIGAAGRLLARRSGAPAALWVVPAILPLLPGLQIVQAMLAATDAARVAGLVGAAGTAFVIGTGVASGDIVVSGVRRFGSAFVAPAVGAVADRVDVLIIAPVGRVVGGVLPGESDSAAAAAEIAAEIAAPGGDAAAGAQPALDGRSAAGASPDAPAR